MAEANEGNPNNAGADDFFLYMGEGGPEVPDDVIRVRVDPSVNAIPERAFYRRTKLEEVELCEGVVEVGKMAFRGCDSLRAINIPSTLRAIGERAFQQSGLSSIALPDGMEVIGRGAFYDAYHLQRVQLPNTLKRIEDWAFGHTLLRSIDLPDGLESIEKYAFYDCKLECLRIPPLVTTLHEGSCFKGCGRLISIELPENLSAVGERTFRYCTSLRNIAIPPDTEVDCDELKFLFDGCNDLQQIFGSQINILQASRARFDGLPIHRMIYYQTHNTVTPDLLDAACNLRSGQSRTLRTKLHPTGNHQDALGMTPLHILACSSKQDLALYKIIIDKYPENLITQDRWGALPILYAIWTNAPNEVIQFLSESYQSIYADYELNWDTMVKTLGLALAPQEVIRKLLDAQQSHFRQQRGIDWEEVLDHLIEGYCDRYYPHRDYYRPVHPEKTFQFLTRCSITRRVNAIGVKQWREQIMLAASSDFSGDMREFRSTVHTKLAEYERQFDGLKEGTTTLELALWKAKIDESQSTTRSQQRTRGRKKIRMDDALCFRYQRRVNCGAETVIRNVLQYLV